MYLPSGSTRESDSCKGACLDINMEVPFGLCSRVRGVNGYLVKMVSDFRDRVRMEVGFLKEDKLGLLFGNLQ